MVRWETWLMEGNLLDINGEKFSKKVTKRNSDRVKRKFLKHEIQEEDSKVPSALLKLVDIKRVGTLALDLLWVIRMKETKRKLWICLLHNKICSYETQRQTRQMKIAHRLMQRQKTKRTEVYLAGPGSWRGRGACGEPWTSASGGPWLGLLWNYKLTVNTCFLWCRMYICVIIIWSVDIRLYCSVMNCFRFLGWIPF